MDAIREFLGWCTVLNFGMMIFSAVMILALRKTVSKIHAKMFDLEEAEVRVSYFRFLANYKIVVIVFNLVPWIALSIMT